ncbi:SAV_915 family protein [Streptomyces sp. NPDC058475]|uniref:SAV_915 family protein n=1 Tax=Streptomyces sp. NPDC058475 TaxID=3346518 RepID=UPI00365BB38D
MADLSCGEDPEPSERFPAGPLYVPVRPGPAGCAARMFRTPLGGRTAVGFTSERRLIATLGPGQEWIRLAEPALRALAAPLGVTTVTVDPQLRAPAPAPEPAPLGWAPRAVQAVGALRATKAPALVEVPALRAGRERTTR